MKKIFVRFTLLSLLIAGQFSATAQNAQTDAVVASSLSSLEAKATIPSFNCNIVDKRVLLNWSVGKNQLANQFIVEKSVDGKHFVMAALVFGTDKTGLDEYKFYEKASSRQTSYRIRILNKDETTTCSAALVAVREKD